MRFNEYRSAQINGAAAPGYSSAQAMKALEEVFQRNHADGNGLRLHGHVVPGKESSSKVFHRWLSLRLSLIFVFLILAALYESWSLPFSVLLSTPIAVFGAFVTLFLRHMENDVYAQIGLVMLDRPGS